MYHSHSHLHLCYARVRPGSAARRRSARRRTSRPRASGCRGRPAGRSCRARARGCRPAARPSAAPRRTGMRRPAPARACARFSAGTRCRSGRRGAHSGPATAPCRRACGGRACGCARLRRVARQPGPNPNPSLAGSCNSRSNGGCPVTSSTASTPTAHTSQALPYPSSSFSLFSCGWLFSGQHRTSCAGPPPPRSRMRKGTACILHIRKSIDEASVSMQRGGRAAHGGHVVEGARARDGPLRPHVDGQAKVCEEPHIAPVTPLPPRAAHTRTGHKEGAPASFTTLSAVSRMFSGCTPHTYLGRLHTAHTNTVHSALSEQRHAAPIER